MSSNASKDSKTIWVSAEVHQEASEIGRASGRNIRKTMELAARIGFKALRKEIDNLEQQKEGSSVHQVAKKFSEMDFEGTPEDKELKEAS